MRTILPPTDRAGKLCGRQKRKPGAAYRPTTNRMIVPCGDGELWYQTLTGELLLFGPGEIPDEDELISRWFLVPGDYDEQTHLHSLRKVLLLARKRHGIHSFTILTTTDCNARCFYCYELGAARVPMSEETARETADYIARARGGADVRLHWFGGEPLYNRNAIEIITDRLRELGISYTSVMTTNGYYLDRETAAHAVGGWCLRRVQITLDGTREIYNKTKAYIDRNDPDPYGRVLENIGHCLDAGIAVQLRLNMDGKNAEDLNLLADELGGRFSDRKDLVVYVAVLREFAGSVHNFRSEEEETELSMALIRRLESNGLRTGRAISDRREAGNLRDDREHGWNRDIRLNCCMADNDGHEVILPDGTIGKCEHFNDAETVGHILRAEKDEPVLRAWREPAEMPECADCPHSPRCVHLKKCPWEAKCPPSARAVRLHAMEQAILAMYRHEENKT